MIVQYTTYNTNIAPCSCPLDNKNIFFLANGHTFVQKENEKYDFYYDKYLLSCFNKALVTKRLVNENVSLLNH